MKVEVIFDHNLFVVLNKPEGVSFHSEEEAGFVVLASKALGYELFGVHRLDKMTSGLLLFAKSGTVANRLTKLFENREIEKYYLAISLRKPKKKQGWVKGDMTRSRRGSYKLTSTLDNPAVTQFVSSALRPHERLFLIKPHTGKTHQIRVALKSIGAAIAGDTRYANADEAKLEDRGYLHAYALRFKFNDEWFSFVNAPTSGSRFATEAFFNQLAQWSKPWELM